MSIENNKMQVDIENLFKQNVNDLSAIKELYRKLKEVEEKILQIKYIDSTLANKLKKEYEKLKTIILDENIQIKLSNDIKTINSQMDNNIRLGYSETNIDTMKKRFESQYVNVKDFGAKGDGVTDDSEPIQKAIDYALENKINNVLFSQGIYIVHLPVLLKTNWRRSHFWGMDGVKLIGEDCFNTVIKKVGNNVHTGINSGVDNIDATIILHDINNEERVGGSGAGLKNIKIVNESTNENSMCVYGKWATNKMQMKDLLIENLNGQGMIFDINVYSSQFINIFNKVKKNALHIDGGTSNYYRMIYSPGASNPYKFYGGYSQIDVVYCDNGSGIIYQIGGSGVTMVGCGCESPNAQYIVSVSKDSHVTIDSLTIHRQIGNDSEDIDCDNTAIFTGNGNVVCNSLRVLNIDKVPEGKTGFVCTSSSTSSSSSFHIENIFYYGTTIGNPKLKHCNVNSSTTSPGGYCHSGGKVFLRRNKFMPYIGMNNNENIYDSPFINKAIYLDNETKLKDSLGNNNSAQKPYNMGDVLLINNPKAMNILGYVVSEVGTSVNSCGYAEIPINLYGSSENRPSNNLYIGLQYFDTTLGKPIWCKSTTGLWVDANGTTV